jgi:hypothetical protein
MVFADGVHERTAIRHSRHHVALRRQQLLKRLGQ